METSGKKIHADESYRIWEMEGALRVVWCANLDHGQVFDLPKWRTRLANEILRESRRAYHM